MCTCISASISQSVFGHGLLIPDRALWVVLELEGSRIGVLNIYAPTDLRCRATFWRTLIELLPDMDSWIVRGDFNNLKTMEDQQGRGPEFVGIAQAEQTVGRLFFSLQEGGTVGETLPFVGGKGAWTTLGASAGKEADF